jgi:hypothetical protein
MGVQGREPGTKGHVEVDGEDSGAGPQIEAEYGGRDMWIYGLLNIMILPILHLANSFLLLRKTPERSDACLLRFLLDPQAAGHG